MDTTSVVRAWMRGDRARHRALVTKFGKIWSYDVMVAKTAPDGTLIIYDYTASAGNFVSRVTTSHVTAIIGTAWKEAEDGRKVIISRKVSYNKRRSYDDKRQSNR